MDPGTIGTGIGIIAALGGLAFAVYSPVLILQLSGWDGLSKTFPVQTECHGRWIDFQTMTFGPLVHFGNCVSLAFTNDYLYMKMWRLLFPFAKPIQIPWSSVASITEEKGVFRSNVVFLLTNGQSFTFKGGSSLRSYITSNAQQSGVYRLLKQSNLES